MNGLHPSAARALPSPGRQLAPKLAIVALYTAGFGLALPALLWRLGERIDRELCLPSLPALPSALLGAAAALLGATLALTAAWELWQRGRGLPVSHLPPRALVDSGPFGRLRHPLYVGFTLALSGAGWLGRSPGVALAAPLLLTVAWLGYARCVEEPLLERRFGPAYLRYVERAPRLPWPRAGRQAGRLVLAALWRLVRPPLARLAARTVLFRVGSTLWVGYGAFVALGAAAAGLLGLGLLGAVLPAPLVAEYLLGLSLSMLLGGRLMWLAYEGRKLRTEPKALMRRVGFVSFGAYCGMFGFTLGWAQLRAPELQPGWLLARTMAACLLCSGFGRLGCLSYGCCYGRPWAHGVCHSAPEAKVNRELGEAGRAPRVPTQVLSALLAFAMAALMLGLLRAGAESSFTVALVALCYALGRFHVESLREESRFFERRLTRGQLLSMSIAAGALLWLALTPVGSALRRPPFSFAWAELLRHAPLALLAAVPVFLVCGYHRGRVGAW